MITLEPVAFVHGGRRLVADNWGGMEVTGTEKVEESAYTEKRSNGEFLGT